MKSDHWTSYQRCIHQIQRLQEAGSVEVHKLETLEQTRVRLQALLEEDLHSVETQRRPITIDLEVHEDLEP